MTNSNTGEPACLICGQPLAYTEAAQTLRCAVCGQEFSSNAACVDGHFVCDACHGQEGAAAVIYLCGLSQSRDPLAIAQMLMQHPSVHMHGPEHHVLVGAALLTAYHNAGGELDLPKALAEMLKRGSKVPGGACGFWGNCGAAISSGIFASIVTGSTPLAGESWGLINRLSAAALQAIGEVGGPRCCKRNSFLAISSTVNFVRENLGVKMELPDEIHCDYSTRNHECIQGRCPFNCA